MATSSPTALARLVEDWPGWNDLLSDPRLTVPDILRALAADRIRVEECREGDSVVVRAELPGMDPDGDIEVTVDNGVLHIRAQREQREESEHDGRVRSDFHYESFARHVPLPDGVSEDDVEATYRDGTLEVRFPTGGSADTTVRTVPVARG